MALFKIIESGTSPQQIAANEHLMKCESRPAAFPAREMLIPSKRPQPPCA